MRWSISNLLIFVVFRSLITLQWHFEKGYWVKTRCHISLIYAGGGGGGQRWHWNMRKKTGIGAWFKCRRFEWKFYKLPKTCRHTRVDSLVAFYEFSITPSCHLHLICRSELAIAHQKGSPWQSLGEASRLHFWTIPRTATGERSNHNSESLAAHV